MGKEDRLGEVSALILATTQCKLTVVPLLDSAKAYTPHLPLPSESLPFENIGGMCIKGISEPTITRAMEQSPS